jgi:two-component system, NarL family, invasion response regulator UvrY
MWRVLIIDDDPEVSADCIRLIGAEPGISEIGHAVTGPEALEHLRRSEWNLALLDTQIPERGGLDILRQIVSTFPNVYVLIMSALPDPRLARQVLRAGARGYFCRNGELAELPKAARIVLEGRRYVSTLLAESMGADLQQVEDQPLHARLSAREGQIFGKIAQGLAVSAIAEELCLSVKTVSTYRSRILEKMNFKSNADIIGYALQNELLPQPA